MRKIKRVLIFTVFMLCMSNMKVQAYTAEDLYADVNVDYVNPYSEDDIDIITRYRCATRYVRIFSHLSTMNFSDLKFDSKMEDELNKIEEYTSQLDNAFELDINEIYEIEESYRESIELLDHFATLQTSEDVAMKTLDTSNIPTYTEYAIANARHNLTTTHLELGGNTPSLTPGAYIVSDFSDESMTIGTSDLAVMTALFNGIVVDVKDDIVTLSHYNNIYTSYKGVTPSVEIGDNVYQGMSVGYSNGTVNIKMRVCDLDVNIYSYLKEFEK